MSEVKPNIIFIFADQMRAQVLGCYGNTQVPTPNLDEMAGAGIVFDNAISPWPVCSPHRAMLLSGRYPMNNGTVHNDTGIRDDIPSIATACRDQGYETGYIGKWHLEWNREPFVPPERRQGFDYWAVNNCTHRYMDHFYCTDTPEEIHFKGYDAVVQTDLAIDYIKANREKPFCLFLSWGPPHGPYGLVPDEYKNRIDPDNIQLRPNVAERSVVESLLELDSPSEQTQERRNTRRALIEDDERLKHECLHGYYAHTAALDDCLGRIRTALSDTGLTDDTILAFSSDHGDMLGSHRMGSKQCPFEESIRIPFVVEYPYAVPKGKRTDGLLAPIDVMPTLLSIAGLDCPEVDGKDISEAALGGKADQQDAVLLMKMLPVGNPYQINAITPWRGVRTKQYTYACLLDHGPWLLYNNLADLYQMDNLINKPEYADLQKDMERRMQELMNEAGDPGDTSVINEFRSRRRVEAGLEPHLMLDT